jgi:hypothetical protein
MEIDENTTGRVFPEASFLHNVDKPFEIHRMIVRLVAFPTSFESIVEIPETQPDTLEERVKLRITDLSKNENLTKAATFVSNLLAYNTGFWDWEEPYTIVRSEGFQVQVDTGDGPTYCIPDNDCESFSITIGKFRVEITFQGFLVVVAPPSETR